MIRFDPSSKLPAYIQIYHQIKENILREHLEKGRRLPSTRELSEMLKVSRNTVEAAYLQLSAEGYIKSRPGSGFFVEDLNLGHFSNTKTRSVQEKKESNPRTSDEQQYHYDFQYGRLSPREFPVKLWRRYLNQAILDGAGNLTSYSEPKGEPGFRIQVMNYLHNYRGVNCSPDQIIILPGTQPCLNLICQLFNKDFHQIAMEDPGYDGARYVFENSNYAITPIGFDSKGVKIAELKKSGSKLIYITPSHQFPMGYVTPIQKRLQLLEWAENEGGYIIEDDYDSELRYSGRPIPSLQCIDRKGRVIYTGTFSKAFSPAIRMSYLVLPVSLLTKYKNVFKEYDCSVPWIQQKALEQFMIEGHWTSHIRKICQSNKRKHDLLIKCLEKYFGTAITIHGKNAGLHILVEFHSGLQERDAISKAKRKGVKIYPVSPYWIRSNLYKNNFVMLGYSSLSEEDILEGTRLLRDAWQAD